MGTLAVKTGEILDIPFVLMDTDGCKTTKCPVEAGKKQTYKYNLDIGTNSSQFPAVSTTSLSLTQFSFITFIVFKPYSNVVIGIQYIVLIILIVEVG